MGSSAEPDLQEGIRGAERGLKGEVNLKSVHPANTMSRQDKEAKDNFYFPKDLNYIKSN